MGEGDNKEGISMGAKGEAYAKQFEAKAEEAAATVEKLSDADWRKTTAAEKWTVAATAHHIARSFEPITGMIQGLAAGRTLPHFTPQMLDEMNAEHAKSGTVFAGVPPMSAEDVIKRALLGHIDEHFGSIRKTISG